MFLSKIRKLGLEWGLGLADLTGVSRESLRYGMRLVKTPGLLKKELKLVGIDSTLATPLWSGNFYLLLTLPSMMVGEMSVLPEYQEDFEFAQSVLRKEDFSVLRERIDRLPTATRDQIFQNLLPRIRRKRKKGNFLPYFDRAKEAGDVEQDLIEESLKILNKEMTNFRTDDLERNVNYLDSCLSNKTNTYLKRNTPTMTKVMLENEADLNRFLDENNAEDPDQFRIEDSRVIEFTKDLKKVLNSNQYQAVSLLIGVAQPSELDRFDDFLKASGLDRHSLSPTRLKIQIEQFVGDREVFSRIKEHKELQIYLRY
jgi:hypothetical protein